MTLESLFYRFVTPPRNAFIRWGVLTLVLTAVVFADYYTGVLISVGVFYMIPILIATAWVGRGAGSAFAVASTVLRLATDAALLYPLVIPRHTIWNAGTGLVLFLFIVWLVSSQLTLQRDIEQKVRERTNELIASIEARRSLEQDVLDIATRERSGFGRELHDGLGQHLVATAIAAQVLSQNLGTSRHARDAGAIVKLIEEAVSKTRRLARGLLLARIAPEDLAQELDELASIAAQTGIDCRMTHQAPVVRASPLQCAQLFRIAQEAVGNALRHSGSDLINITLSADDDSLRLLVEDHGHGFDRSQGPAGIGIRNMEYRASVIGASLSIASTASAGTRVECRLPTEVAV